MRASTDRIARTNFKRLEQFERVRLQRREEHCQVKIAEFIMETYRSSELFCTWNHPSGRSLVAVARSLLEMSGLLTDSAHPALPGDLAYAEAYWNPFRFFELPVHAGVADALELKWFDPDKQYEIAGAKKTPQDYFMDYFGE
jgi:hypothetical protein